MTTPQHRQAALDKIVEDYDEKAAQKEQLTSYRFMSIERDAVASGMFLKGHKSLRGACDYLARVCEEGERFVPVSIVDLDEEYTHEVEVHCHVTPKGMRAVSLLLPHSVAVGLAAAVSGDGRLAPETVRFLERALEGKGV